LRREKYKFPYNAQGSNTFPVKSVDSGGLIFPGDDILAFNDVRVPRAQVLDAPMEQTMDQLKETM
jgi:hypothetical protein